MKTLPKALCIVIACMFVFQALPYCALADTGKATDTESSRDIPQSAPGFSKPKISSVTSNSDQEATKYAESDNQKIIDLAKTITKDCKTDKEKAQAIFDYIQDNYSYKYYYRTAAGALEMLNKKEGNGADLSHLFVALCRASGLEARYKHVRAGNASGMGSGVPSEVERIFAQVKVNGKWENADPADKRNKEVGKLAITIKKDIQTYTEYANKNTTNVTLASKTTPAKPANNTTPTANATTTVPESLKSFLQATTHCEVNNAAIKAKAAAITKGKTSDYDKAAAIFNWVRDNIDYSFYYNSKYGAAGTLSSKRGNCCDTASLVIAMCRASGIAARYVHTGDAKFASGTYGHVWAQVYVNGKWVAADATSYRNSLGVIKNWSGGYTKNTYAALPF